MKTSKTVTISKVGKKPITFKKGGLHSSLGVPQGKKIPAGKMAAAASGKDGAKAKKQALFAKNVLTGPKKKKKSRLLIKKNGNVTATKKMQKLMGFNN